MPRRAAPDPLARQIGRRVRQLREEAGLTLEKLAWETKVKSKGFMSDIEQGLARPSVQTLSVIARRLGVDLLDLVTFPAKGERQALVDATRDLSPGTVRKWLKEALEARAKKRATVGSAR